MALHRAANRLHRNRHLVGERGTGGNYVPARYLDADQRAEQRRLREERYRRRNAPPPLDPGPDPPPGPPPDDPPPDDGPPRPPPRPPTHHELGRLLNAVEVLVDYVPSTAHTLSLGGATVGTRVTDPVQFGRLYREKVGFRLGVGAYRWHLHDVRNACQLVGGHYVYVVGYVRVENPDGTRDYNYKHGLLHDIVAALVGSDVDEEDLYCSDGFSFMAQSTQDAHLTARARLAALVSRRSSRSRSGSSSSRAPGITVNGFRGFDVRNFALAIATKAGHHLHVYCPSSNGCLPKVVSKACKMMNRPEKEPAVVDLFVSSNVRRLIRRKEVDDLRRVLSPHINLVMVRLRPRSGWEYTHNTKARGEGRQLFLGLVDERGSLVKDPRHVDLHCVWIRRSDGLNVTEEDARLVDVKLRKRLAEEMSVRDLDECQDVVGVGRCVASDWTKYVTLGYDFPSTNAGKKQKKLAPASREPSQCFYYDLECFHEAGMEHFDVPFAAGAIHLPNLPAFDAHVEDWLRDGEALHFPTQAQVFEGEYCLLDMLDWMFKQLGRHCKSHVKAYAFNGAGYDVPVIFSNLTFDPYFEVTDSIVDGGRGWLSLTIQPLDLWFAEQNWPKTTMAVVLRDCRPHHAGGSLATLSREFGIPPQYAKLDYKVHLDVHCWDDVHRYRDRWHPYLLNDVYSVAYLNEATNINRKNSLGEEFSVHRFMSAAHLAYTYVYCKSGMTSRHFSAPRAKEFLASGLYGAKVEPYCSLFPFKPAEWGGGELPRDDLELCACVDPEETYRVLTLDEGMRDEEFRQFLLSTFGTEDYERVKPQFLAYEGEFPSFPQLEAELERLRRLRTNLLQRLRGFDPFQHPTRCLDELDFNSLYPTVMKYYPLPLASGDPPAVYSNDEATLRGWLRDRNGTVEIPNLCRLPYDHYALFRCSATPPDDRFTGVVPNRLDGTLYWSLEPFENRVHSNLTLHAAELQGWTITRLFEGVRFDSGHQMSGTISDLYDLRLRLKREKKNLEQNTVKLIMNGCYGKFSMKDVPHETEVKRKRHLKESDLDAITRWKGMSGDGSHYLVKMNSRKQFVTSKQVGMAILDGARHVMNMVLHHKLGLLDVPADQAFANGTRVAYTDTDSLYCTFDLVAKCRDLIGGKLGEFKRDTPRAADGGEQFILSLQSPARKLKLVVYYDGADLGVKATCKGMSKVELGTTYFEKASAFHRWRARERVETHCTQRTKRLAQRVGESAGVRLDDVVKVFDPHKNPKNLPHPEDPCINLPHGHRRYRQGGGLAQEEQRDVQLRRTPDPRSVDREPAGSSLRSSGEGRAPGSEHVQLRPVREQHDQQPAPATGHL